MNHSEEGGKLLILDTFSWSHYGIVQHGGKHSRNTCKQIIKVKLMLHDRFLGIYF